MFGVMIYPIPSMSQCECDCLWDASQCVSYALLSSTRFENGLPRSNPSLPQEKTSSLRGKDSRGLMLSSLLYRIALLQHRRVRADGDL